MNDQNEVGEWAVDRLTYHSDRTRLSHSAMECFRKSIPSFHAVHVLGTIPPSEPSEEMSFGSNFHTAILQPDLWALQKAVAPRVDRRTTVGKEAWATFLKRSEGKTPVTEEENFCINSMVWSVMNNPESRKLIEAEGRIEQPIRWTDEVTGMAMRSMLDKYIPETNIIADVKSCSDPSPEAFLRSVIKYGYHRQAALYSVACTQVYAPRPWFVFIAVCKIEPFETFVYELDTDFLVAAFKQNREDLDEIHERKSLNNWEGRGHGRTITLSLPGRMTEH